MVAPMKRLIPLAALALAACATPPQKIRPAEVPASKYAGYSCEQLAGERERSKARTDALRLGMRAIDPLGNRKRGREYAQARGEYFAAEQAAVQKDCPAYGVVAQPTSLSVRVEENSAAGATAPGNKQ
jgi:hypothetical protein